MRRNSVSEFVSLSVSESESAHPCSLELPHGVWIWRRNSVSSFVSGPGSAPACVPELTRGGETQDRNKKQIRGW